MKPKIVNIKSSKPSGKGPLPQFKDCLGHVDREKGDLMMEKVLDIIGGKWKMLVLFHLGMNGTVRFGELKRKIPGVTQRMLTLTLREMEKDGIVNRKVYPEVPPKVEYRLTEEGADLKEVYVTMGKWGFKHAKMLEGSEEKVSGQ
jgi:DNA-binding HxlR family transcriptional regulator